MTTTKVNPLKIEHDGRKSGPPWNSIELAGRSYSGAYDEGYPYRITMWNDGFEATHEIDFHGLREIHKWIDKVLVDNPDPED